MVWVQSISPRPQLNNFSRDTVPLTCRRKVAPGVMVASEDPPEVSMEPHLEMSYNSLVGGPFFVFQSWAKRRRPKALNP